MELNLTICSLIFQTRHARTDKQKFQFQRSNTIDRSEILLEELSKCLWAPKHPSIKKGRTKKKRNSYLVFAKVVRDTVSRVS